MSRRVQLPEAEVLGHEAAQAYLAWCRGRSVDTAGDFVEAMRRFKGAVNQLRPGLRRVVRPGEKIKREYAQALRLLAGEESV